MFQKSILIVVLSSIVFFISCKKELNESQERGKVTVEFNHKVGADHLSFNEKKYINVVGHQYDVRTLKYFISNLTFTPISGDAIIIKSPLYVNADDISSLIKKEIVELPFGTYSSIGFSFGIDSLMNVSDTLQTVEEAAMAWGMGSGGYHYMKLEGTYDSLGVDSITKSYALHTGPSMGKSYDFHITFKNSAFTINEEGLSLEITMDVNEWFTGSSNDENYDFCNYGQMIMMNAEAQKKLKENGNSVFSIDVK